jgi:hypothetical protein
MMQTRAWRDLVGSRDATRAGMAGLAKFTKGKIAAGRPIIEIKSMDHLHYRLNFDPDKSRQKFHITA